ncbi:MAG: uracil-DNA glycosylase [Nitrospirae bacterium]|nr:uracil-DNA glycosylase [Nitrospirota bacterium]
MNNKIELIDKLKKSLEFYQELGFEYLPLKRADISNVISAGAVSDYNPATISSNQQVAEQPVDYSSNKEITLEDLKNEIGDCHRCKLSKGRKNIVFGEGKADADIMFIGEGPGRDEDIQGRPFVGDAGKLLTNLILKLGLRRQDVYIANIVKCRPPSNRNPEEDEISTCAPFVERQIAIIKPKVIVCLGKIAAQTLLKTNVPISKLRGNFFSYKNIPVMPTFHPAYLLRNPKDKWLTWEDMQKVLDKLK